MTLLCGYVVVLGAIVILLVWLRTPQTLVHSKVADASVIYALGGLLWPFVWSLVCGHAMSTMPWFGFIGLAWPPLLLLVDVAFASHASGQDPSKQTYGMQIDGQALSGLALTLGGVLMKYVSDGFATSAAPMTMATVLVVLLLLFPNTPMHAESRNANVMRGVQKVALQFCLGFSITAVAIALGVGMLRAPQSKNELHKVMVKSM